MRRATYHGRREHRRLRYFYPRSPCGERPIRIRECRKRKYISIHALLAESDLLGLHVGSHDIYFYPRSPCGERHLDSEDCTLVPYFYPRSPCGERRKVRVVEPGLLNISIHALLAESDLAGMSDKLIGSVFLSTLSLRRATSVLHSFRPLQEHFYPRSPCGERQRT